MLCKSHERNGTKKIIFLFFSFSSINLAFWWFLFSFFMWFVRFQILIPKLLSIWYKLFVLRWLYISTTAAKFFSSCIDEDGLRCDRYEKIIAYCARVSNQLWLPRAVFSTNKKWTLKPRWQPVMGTLTQKSMTLSENWSKTFSHYQQFAHTQGKQF